MTGNWSTWRHTTAAPTDTLLTKYQPGDVTDAVRAKMISLDPDISAVALRAFGRDAAGQLTDIVISGWMEMRTPSQGLNTAVANVGCGHRLWAGRLTLGTKSIDAGQVPNDDPVWRRSNSAAWLEAHSWDHTAALGYDPAGATHLEVANQEAMLVLPTYHYRSLLLEFRPATSTMTAMGVLWRPLSRMIGQWI